ncbi:putative asparagine synthase [Lachancea thermotolerans CBS 6340]|uniref:KLTH0E16412p n=1 Tax=Lachancea thermotolerans (strain ATCC 56472 / CBS 6340 / NRRL Y-8284) TaxID=559295 RepID=C5DIZ6_LACTC|nr:KLTH0E16412p [Lachancea thermotolerans CBS 6340]CAR23757.1 KLTH0E16412p [Lachancea thermotolerans CBS 6340]
MCGILLHCHGCSKIEKDIFQEIHEANIARGDYMSYLTPPEELSNLIPYIVDRGPNYASLKTSKDDNMTWFTSVLSLREPFTKQCIEVEDRFVLQYNGEIYNSSISHNDTQYIAEMLLNAKDIPSVIRTLSGEFAYTIYDKLTGEVFFGRDPIGRRSLSFKLDTGDSKICISSVSGKIEGFQDCQAGVIYVFQKNTGELKSNLRINSERFAVSNKVDHDLSQIVEQSCKLYEHISAAVRKRVTTIHPMHTENRPISILFSGGLDCSVITSLICQQILDLGGNIVLELLNVGFENPRTGLSPSQVPDRILGQRSASILRALYPQVQIMFVEVDVPYSEFLKYKAHIMNMIYPKQTEMDLSIAAAFYFASRGEGFVNEPSGTRISYKRKGLVLFSGLGADELYGGYHKFSKRANEELVPELEVQINNIYDRNLNRDDKVISSNGVEIRYPFLDDQVVAFSTQLPINYKVNKMILRKVASQNLNLSSISEEPKRAIQFGAKSAKMTKNGNKQGTDLVVA